MFDRREKFLALACLLSSSACVESSVDISEETRANPQTVNELVRYVDSLDCGPGDTGCRQIDVTFDKRWFDSAQFDQQTILVIDSGIDIYATLKYRSRVKNVYKAGDDGRLVEHRPSLTMPEYLDHIFEHLAARQFIRASKLKPLANKLSEDIHRFSERHRAAHGDIPLQFLMENNPRAAVVMIERLRPFEIYEAEFCAHDVGAFTRRVRQLANDLEQVIDTNNVHFVNFSAGDTPQTVMADHAAICGGNMNRALAGDFLRALLPIYTTLFASPGVLGVQAGAAGTAVAYDCDARAFPNRIRAGYFSVLESGLDPRGELAGGRNYLSHSIPANQIAVEDCLDVLVNFGVKEERPFPHNQTPYMIADIFGFSEEPITFAHTSWAAPLVLSRAIHIVTEELQSSAVENSTIVQVKRAIAPPGCEGWRPDHVCKYQDPLKHHQLLSMVVDP